MKKTGINILAATALSLSIVSCSESFDTSFFDKEKEDLNIALGLKIGYSEYSAKDLWEEIGDDIEVGEKDDNGNPLVNFTYTEELDSGDNSSFVSIDGQNFDGDFDLLANSGLVGSFPYVAGAIAGDLVSDSFSEIQTLQGLDSELTEVNFSEGTFTITLSTNTEAQTAIEFIIPSLINKTTSQVYTQNFILNNNAGIDITSIPVDLDDYTFDFTIDNLDPETKTGFNNIGIKLNATITLETGDVVSADNTLSYDISLGNPKVKNAKGDFKNAGFDVDAQSFDLDFFDTLGEGDISFLNPILKLTANSGYGFPIGLTLDSISGVNVTDTVYLEINDNTPLNDNIEQIVGGQAGDSYAIINAAATNGLTEQSIITLNADNSNLKDLLNAKPTSFNINVIASANPNNPTGNSNFFDTSNSLEIDVEVELPLYVTFDGLTFSPEPFEFDGDDIEDLEENVNSLELLLFTRNSIPLEGSIDLQFLNDNGDILFTKETTLMEAAPIDSDNFSTYTLNNGVLTEGSTIIEPTKTTVTFSNEEISDLANTSNIQAVIEFNTTDSSPAKIKSTDTVRLDLSLIGDFEISNEEDDNN